MIHRDCKREILGEFQRLNLKHPGVRASVKLRYAKAYVHTLSLAYTYTLLAGIGAINEEY